MKINELLKGLDTAPSDPWVYKGYMFNLRDQLENSLPELLVDGTLPHACYAYKRDTEGNVYTVLGEVVDIMEGNSTLPNADTLLPTLLEVAGDDKDEFISRTKLSDKLIRAYVKGINDSSADIVVDVLDTIQAQLQAKNIAQTGYAFTLQKEFEKSIPEVSASNLLNKSSLAWVKMHDGVIYTVLGELVTILSSSNSPLKDRLINALGADKVESEDFINRLVFANKQVHMYVTAED